MRIDQIHSHLNGLEYLKANRPHIYEEIVSIIRSVDAEEIKTKVSKEKKFPGKLLYNPAELNNKFKSEFNAACWNEQRYQYYVTTDPNISPTLLKLDLERQLEELKKIGQNSPIRSYKQTDFVKERVSVEIQFGKYTFVAYDLFVKHLFFYTGYKIDVGIEILPVKAMKAEMSSGVAYYEGELHNILVQGRNIPAVPLVLIGVAP